MALKTYGRPGRRKVSKCKGERRRKRELEGEAKRRKGRDWSHVAGRLEVLGAPGRLLGRRERARMRGQGGALPARRSPRAQPQPHLHPTSRHLSHFSVSPPPPSPAPSPPRPPSRTTGPFRALFHRAYTRRAALAMPKSFVMLGQRHPRYTIALALLVLGAYWFFFNDPPPPVTYKLNSDLKLRLDREERKYREMLPQRQALISKFGPTPSQLVMSVARPPLLLHHRSYHPQVPPRPGPLAAIHRLCVLAAMFAARAPLIVHSPGDFFPPIFNCPHEMDRLGALGDGGKWLCGISRIQDKPDCVVYSFGASLFPPCPARASPLRLSLLHPVVHGACCPRLAQPRRLRSTTLHPVANGQTCAARS